MYVYSGIPPQKGYRLVRETAPRFNPIVGDSHLVGEVVDLEVGGRDDKRDTGCAGPCRDYGIWRC
jgi:hypothetical protein